jgi:hypothetical protein
MTASRNGRVDASLFGISDSEILGIVDDLADENGWTATYDVRMQLGEKVTESDYRSRSGVGSRLAWLRRYGWVEKGEREKIEQSDGTWVWTQRWRLTAMGHALLDNPDLSKAVESALNKLNPAQRLRLTRELGDAGSGTAPEIRNALRRQWQRSMRVR